jgi:thiol:disulfide interchange protein DsbD
MEHRTSLAILVAAAVAAVGPAAAEDFGPGNARVQLVSSARLPQPGESVFLGVLFDIRPGWHIYWKNPGGAGLATDVRWRLPAGVEPGDLLWPVPVAFTQSGDIPGYGYEGSVILAAGILSAKELGGNTVVGASVSWLACKDVCVLGSAELSAPLAEIADDRLSEDWAASLPQPIPSSDPPLSLRTTGSLSDGTIGLWLQWRAAPAAVEWFPDPPSGLEVENVTVQTRGGLTRVDAVVRLMAGSTVAPDTLDSVVVVTDENHQRRGWDLAVDLTTEAQ